MIYLFQAPLIIFPRPTDFLMNQEILSILDPGLDGAKK